MTEEVQRLSNPSGKGKLIAPIGPCKNVSFLASQGPTKLTNHHYLQMIIIINHNDDKYDYDHI